MMSSIFKSNLSISIFGESHQETMGIVIDGLAAGLTLDFDFVDAELKRRRPILKSSTSRVEEDDYEIVSGYFNHHTTGTPLCILVKNNQFNSEDYQPNLLRSSSVDYVTFKKYNGFFDYRGSGHLSGRITVLYVIAGAICKQILKQKGIQIVSHIKQIKDIKDDTFTFKNLTLEMKKIEKEAFPVLNETRKQEMIDLIQKAKEANDSIGGIIETIIYPFPVGIGEPLFDSLESHISRLIFSIPAIKGISFGLGFDYVSYMGSQVKDEWNLKENQFQTNQNCNGGINGGISNGMPIVFDCVIKPTASIASIQNTVDIHKMENTTFELKGRHDACIASRCGVIIESMAAIATLDLIIASKGKEWML